MKQFLTAEPDKTALRDAQWSTVAHAPSACIVFAIKAVTTRGHGLFPLLAVVWVTKLNQKN